MGAQWRASVRLQNRVTQVWSHQLLTQRPMSDRLQLGRAFLIPLDRAPYTAV